MEQTDILLVTAPFIQYNSPYPATTVLKGFVQLHGYTATQLDLGIETIDLLFSPDYLKAIFSTAKEKYTEMPVEYQRMVDLESKFVSTINMVKRFLQGRDPHLAFQICNGLIPQGPAFANMADIETVLEQLDTQDKAKYLATLYMSDIARFITDFIDQNFDFCRYAEHFHDDKSSFPEIEQSLKADTLVTDVMCKILSEKIEECRPKAIGISIPFPGNLVAALKMGGLVKQHFPAIKVIMGGGFVSCELRSLKEPKVFDYADFVCLDDGERPVLQILDYLAGKSSKDKLVRTFIRQENEVQYINASLPDFRHSEIRTPDFSGLPLNKYMSVFSVVNPMHRLWNDGRWNKMVLAHGCYWHRCSFCDTTLDYIKRYSQADASVLCDRIEAIVEQTGQSGFHFVDEAAPPALLRNLALEILRRNLHITWWTNVRFDTQFTADLCQLLALSGCIAVSGGLEAASDRLLEKMQKGISIEQVSQVTSNFQQAGIMVHTYLMYGFPTQTVQEIIDSLEVVRQLFEQGLIDSGFWHLYVMTIHSETGIHPEKFGVKRIDPAVEAFPQNDCDHIDPSGVKYTRFAEGLRKSLYNFMHGNCIDNELQDWFDFKIPQTKVAPDLIEKYLDKPTPINLNTAAIVVWTGVEPITFHGKKGKVSLELHINSHSFALEQLSEAEATWLCKVLKSSMPDNPQFMKLCDWNNSYTQEVNQPFDLFLTSRNWNKLRKNGLLVV